MGSMTATCEPRDIQAELIRRTSWQMQEIARLKAFRSALASEAKKKGREE